MRAKPAHWYVDRSVDRQHGIPSVVDWWIRRWHCNMLKEKKKTKKSPKDGRDRKVAGSLLRTRHRTNTHPLTVSERAKCFIVRAHSFAMRDSEPGMQM